MSAVIVLTGGGTAGHVMPNLALLDELRRAGFTPHYVGGHGIERELALKAGIPFHGVLTGKLRRYISLRNFLDVFRLIAGICQAIVLIARLKPRIVFSKGGFVAVPVTLAAWVFGVPVVTHESDYSPGLANRIIIPFSRKILYTFPETAKYLPKEKATFVGTPVRSELFEGDAEKGQEFCGFKGSDKPILLVMGGSQGAQRINDALREILPNLLETFNVVHLTGRGKQIDFHAAGYKGFEFVGPELKDIFAASSLVVSRAGANSIFELLALKKPMLLIPLEIGSRGDQILNAKSFVTNGWAASLSESDLSPGVLSAAIMGVHTNAANIRAKQAELSLRDVPRSVVAILLTEANLG